MHSGKYIQQKFQAWAKRENIVLQGSEGERGEPNYTLTVGQNIFGGRLLEETQRNFKDGAGGELQGNIPTMSALHSSAAMAVNLFQYLISTNAVERLATILKIPSTGISSCGFERKYPVCESFKTRGFNEPPHLDLGIDYTDERRVGVECKLFEPYYSRPREDTLAPAYLQLRDEWNDIPNSRALAERIRKKQIKFRRLCPAQLLKHILGIKYGKQTNQVRLIYLYYDAIGSEAEEHRLELMQFSEIVSGDPFWFVPMTVQEFVIRAFEQCVEQQHQGYVSYVCNRYL